MMPLRPSVLKSLPATPVLADHGYGGEVVLYLHRVELSGLKLYHKFILEGLDGAVGVGIADGKRSGVLT